MQKAYFSHATLHNDEIHFDSLLQMQGKKTQRALFKNFDHKHDVLSLICMHRE